MLQGGLQPQTQALRGAALLAPFIQPQAQLLASRDDFLQLDGMTRLAGVLRELSSEQVGSFRVASGLVLGSRVSWGGLGGIQHDVPGRHAAQTFGRQVGNACGLVFRL